MVSTNLPLEGVERIETWNGKRLKMEEDLVTTDELEFSLTRYEPMARLLSEEDFLFLKAQPGFRPEMGRKFRRERRRIFRLYLHELGRDFRRLHAQARVAVSTLAAEHSALVGVIIRGQLRFWYEMAAIEMQLTLSWAGVSVDARALVEAVGNMQIEINRFAVPTLA